MGKYINKNSKGQSLPTIGKAQALINDGGTRIVEIKFQENLICVVANPFFDAAAYCYSESEFEVFTGPNDNRFKTWLTHPKAKELVD